jgi:hypothetical protein
MASAQRLMNQRPTDLSKSLYRSVGGCNPISMSTNVPFCAAVSVQR